AVALAPPGVSVDDADPPPQPPRSADPASIAAATRPRARTCPTPIIGRGVNQTRRPGLHLHLEPPRKPPPSLTLPSPPCSVRRAGPGRSPAVGPPPTRALHKGSRCSRPSPYPASSWRGSRRAPARRP